MAVPIPHTTQQNFVIAQIAKMDTSRWSSNFVYLNQYPLPPKYDSTTYTSYTYIFIECLTFISLWACATEGTLQQIKMPT